MEKEKTNHAHAEHHDAKETLREAKAKVNHAMDEVKEKMEEVEEHGKEKVKETKEKVKDFGNKHPWSFLGQLEAIGVEYLVTKAPFQLPVGLKDFMVKIAPYLVCLLIILLIPLILALIGLGSYFSGRGSMNHYYYAGGTIFYITSIISVIVLVIEALALPGLFAKKKQGWNLLFYAQLVSVVSTLISGDIVSAILSLVIGMYLLFQVRSYYK